MKKTSYLFMIVVLLSTFINFSETYAEQKETSEETSLQLAEDAEAAILLERDTGEIIYEKNVHEKLPPASLTKVMTLLLVMEAIHEGELSKDETITVSKHAASMGGSQVFLAEGEQISVDDLIKSVAIASANDASVALAERIAGSEPAFVERMNEKAERLQLENTKFQNSSGLPAKNHYTSAYDIALMSRELLKYEDITTYTSIYEDYLRKGKENEFWLVNTNRLVRFFPYVDGLKTGYTKEAKFCLAATAKKDDMRVVSVVMGAETSQDRNAATMDLIDYAFNHYETEKVYERGEVVGQLRHLQAEQYEYPLKTSEPISILHKKGDQDRAYETRVTIIEDESLPVPKGSQLGSIVVQTKDKQVIESPILAEEAIERASIGTLLKRSLKLLAKFE